MIATMIISSALGAYISGLLPGRAAAASKVARDDSKLSELDLSDATGSELTVAEIVEKNSDAVVEIIVSGTTQNMWGQMQLTQGAGSGVIVSEDGYIATNHHVIQGARTVQVTLHNGDSYPAKIVGSDQANDIAVIKIDAKNLTTATIGDSSTVEVGDMAVAIGNPLGQLGGTATAGIISALDRTLDIEGTTLNLLQTDAAINGGNSGGGLFNSKGELIGIVESKASAVGVEGLGFALPINNVSPLINDMIENGGNAQTAKGTPAVGIVISDVSEENAQYYGLESAGVYIAQVTGANAMQAGFQAEDRIVSFNGKEISNSSEFISLVRECKVGDTVTIVVSRQGQMLEIKTVLEELQN
jgi:serine protease Do